jgi:hypothetical protein
MTDRKFGNFEAAIRVAHSRHKLAGANKATLGFDCIHALFEAVLNCLNDLVKAKPLLQVLLGSPANFAINYAIGG